MATEDIARIIAEKNVKFLSRLDTRLIRFNYNGLGLILYIPSDEKPIRNFSYRGVFVFPEDLIIDKDKFDKISNFVIDMKKDSIKIFDRDIITDVDVLDYGILKDARFNFFNFRGEPRASRPSIIGTNYLSIINYNEPSNYPNKLLREQLRKVRKDLLLSEYNRECENHVANLEAFNYALKSAFDSHKLLVEMSPERQYKASKHGLSGLGDLFLKVNDLEENGLSLVDRIDVSGLYIDEYNKFKDIWYGAVDAIEYLIKDYIDQYGVVVDGQIYVDPLVDLSVRHGISTLPPRPRDSDVYEADSVLTGPTVDDVFADLNND